MGPSSQSDHRVLSSLRGDVARGMILSASSCRWRFRADATAIALGVWLSKMVFVLVLFQGLASIMQSVLYARHSYLVSCSGKFVTNVVAIIVVFAFQSRYGIQALAAGMVLGSCVQLVLPPSCLPPMGFDTAGCWIDRTRACVPFSRRSAIRWSVTYSERAARCSRMSSVRFSAVAA